MRITRYTDYSLRVLIFVALKRDEISTIGEIADAYQISKNHLRKVVHELSCKGYIHASRGKNGGMRLNRPAQQINIGELVRQTEQDLALVECFGQESTCVLTPACELKHVLNQALEAFFACLDKYTLADLLPQEQQDNLIRLLGFTPDITRISHRKS